MNKVRSALWWESTPHVRKEHAKAVKVYDLETGELKRTEQPGIKASRTKVPYVKGRRETCRTVKCVMCGQPWSTRDPEPDLACPACRAKPGTPEVVTCYDRVSGKVVGQWHSLVKACKDMGAYTQKVTGWLKDGRQPADRWTCWCFGEPPAKPPLPTLVIARDGEERAWLSMTAYARAYHHNTANMCAAVREGRDRVEHKDGTVTTWRVLTEYEDIEKGQ